MTQSPQQRSSHERDFITRDAHRQPALPMVSPAATRHLAFRRPAERSLKEWQSLAEEGIKQTLIKSIEFARVHGTNDAERSIVVSDLTSVKTLSKISGPEQIDLIRTRCVVDLDQNDKIEIKKVGFRSGTFGGRFQHLAISGHWNSLTYRISFENFDDYLTVGCTIEICNAASDLAKVFDELVTKLNVSSGQLLTSPDVPTGLDIGQLCASLYATAWGTFEADLLGEGLYKDGLSEKLFQDLRGLVCHGASGDGMHAASIATPSVVEERPQTLSRKLGRIIGERDQAAIDALVAGALHPVLAALNPTPSGVGRLAEALRASEYSFSLLAEGRFVIGTSFTTYPVDSTKGQPTWYVLYATHENREQTGRMVSRFHTLETIRLSALFDYEKLIERDQILVRLDEELRDIEELKCSDAESRKDVDVEALVDRMQLKYLQRLHKPCIKYKTVGDLIPASKQEGAPVKKLPCNEDELKEFAAALRVFERNHSEHADVDHVRSAIRFCDRAQERSEFVLRDVLLDQVGRAMWTMDGTVEGGISQLAFRTRYSRELFDSLSSAMRIKRLTGYQPYDLFIRHRLERAYGFIEGIDAKFRTVFAKESHLGQLRDRQQSIKDQATIKELQLVAEIGLFFLLAPYYASHVAETLTEAVVHAAPIAHSAAPSATLLVPGKPEASNNPPHAVAVPEDPGQQADDPLQPWPHIVGGVTAVLFLLIATAMRGHIAMKFIRGESSKVWSRLKARPRPPPDPL